MVNINNALILSNEMIAPDIYGMELRVPEIAEASRPGQFVNLYTGDFSALLPRPISICLSDRERGSIALVYRVSGKGTGMFARLKPGDTIRVLGPLGNGYSLEPGEAVIVGGGVGIPPLLGLASALSFSEPGRKISVYLGYRNSDAFLLDKFRKVCGNAHVATDDGSIGFKGNVLELIKDNGVSPEGYIYACGPRPLLNGLAGMWPEHMDKMYLSLEERMGCGTGVCVGCAVAVRDGEGGKYKRVCKDGPVFRATDLIFE